MKITKIGIFLVLIYLIFVFALWVYAFNSNGWGVLGAVAILWWPWGLPLNLTENYFVIFSLNMISLYFIGWFLGFLLKKTFDYRRISCE